MNRRRIAVIISGILLLAATTFAQDREKKIKQSDLPAAVQKTVAAESKGATVRGFSKETEKGQTYYEAALTVNGHTKDISIDTNGKVVEIEEEVPFDSLIDTVKQGLQAKAGKGKLGEIESLTKNGKLVAYEAKVTTGTKKSEVQVGPDGKPLAHEE
jgi:hypothetical protein